MTALLFRLALMLLLAGALRAPAQENCKACHAEHVEEFQKHPHHEKALSCEACHGASEGHINSNGTAAPDRKTGPEDVPALCGECHAEPLNEFRQSKHARTLAAKSRAASCTSCHGSHSVKTAVAMKSQCSRCHQKLPAACSAPPAAPAAEGKLSCLGCHARHTMTPRK